MKTDWRIGYPMERFDANHPRWKPYALCGR
jgi:hypothetical protein